MKWSRAPPREHNDNSRVFPMKAKTSCWYFASSTKIGPKFLEKNQSIMLCLSTMFWQSENFVKNCKVRRHYSIFLKKKMKRGFRDVASYGKPVENGRTAAWSFLPLKKVLEKINHRERTSTVHRKYPKNVKWSFSTIKRFLDKAFGTSRISQQ